MDLELINHYIALAVQAITLLNGMVTLKKAMKKNYEDFNKYEWLAFCKKFKKYIESHSELKIEIIQTEKKTTMYRHQ